MSEDEHVRPALLLEETPPLPDCKMSAVCIESSEILVFNDRCAMNQYIVDSIYGKIIIQRQRFQVSEDFCPGGNPLVLYR